MSFACFNLDESFYDASAYKCRDAKLRKLLRRIQLEKGNFPIHTALRLGLLQNFELLEVIRSYHLSVCNVDYMGLTPYMIAIEENSDISIVNEIIGNAAKLCIGRLEIPLIKRNASHLMHFSERKYFRLNLPIARVKNPKVYFELTISTDETCILGFCSLNWYPNSLADFVVFDGKKKRIERRDPRFTLTPDIPSWVAGTVIGASIDLTQDNAIVEFWLGGGSINVNDGDQNITMCQDEVFAVFGVAGDEAQEFSLNFGERGTICS